MNSQIANILNVDFVSYGAHRFMICFEDFNKNQWLTDIVDKNKRSYIMRQVKSSRNKSTELKLISIFKELSIKGWRRGYKLKGKPDFVFLKEKTAVFVDGCFWHGHTCKRSIPQTNTDYWISKIRKNIKILVILENQVILVKIMDKIIIINFN